jgi:hypothetical protein
VLLSIKHEVRVMQKQTLSISPRLAGTRVRHLPPSMWQSSTPSKVSRSLWRSRSSSRESA